MGSNHQAEKDITKTLEQHYDWNSVGMGSNQILLLWNNITGIE